MKKIFIFSFVLFIFVFSVGTINAQLNIVGETPVSVEIVPQVPGPNEKVMVKVESYGTDLNSGLITWYLNGKKELSGKGQKIFYFDMGPSNSTTKLEIQIITTTGETINRSYNFKPTSVDIIWQNDGYVPPFYKGKALYSYQNKITFIAIPHILNSLGVEMNPNNLIYKWTKNGTVLGDYSGYGKNTYTMISGIIARPLTIEVEVTSTSGNEVARSSIYVEPIDPQIFVYEKSPLYGILFEKALVGDVSYNNLSEIEILSIPYFFGTTNAKNSNLPYKWSINYNKIDEDTTQNSRFFRPKEGVSGSSYISVSIESLDKVLQSATGGFNLKFTNEETSGSENQTF